MSYHSKATIILLSLALLTTGRAGALSTEDANCRSALGKGVAKLVKAVMKEEGKCHKSRMSGDPAFAAIDCNVIAQLPQKSQDKITKKEGKLAGAGGIADKKCAQSGASSASALGFRTCPAPCDSVLITDYLGVGACLACLAKSEATTAVLTAYGSTPPVGGNRDALACQVAVGKSQLKYKLALMKGQQSCQALADTHEAPTIPTTNCKTADLDGKIADAKTKADTSIAEKCATGLSTLTSCAADVAGEQACIDASAKSSANELFDDVYPPIGGTSRPSQIHIPPSYSPATPMPLVVLLHGYGMSGSFQEAYFSLTSQSDSRGFLYAYPDGTLDSDMKRFWNATDACCNFDPIAVDDVAYVTSIIDDMSFHYNVDPKRIFVIGYSNGGFMAQRLACDRSDKIAAIMSLAGATWNDAMACNPTDPVSVLAVHGTADTVISYSGGMIRGFSYPSAQTTVDDWVGFDGCTNMADLSSPPLDLDSNVAGNETTIEKYAAGCMSGTGVELWSIVGGPHNPGITPSFRTGVIDFLFAHPKP